MDLCNAGAFSEHIASSAERRQRVDAFMWQVQQSLLPAVQKRYVNKVLKRTGAWGVSDLVPGFQMSACALVPLLLVAAVRASSIRGFIGALSGS